MKKRIICIALAVVLCLAVTGVAFAADSPSDSWLSYEGVPAGYDGYYDEMPEEDAELLNDYLAENYPGEELTEIGFVWWEDANGDLYTGGATLRVEDADVKAGDKVIIIAYNYLTDEIIEIEAVAYDGYFVFQIPENPGSYGYFVKTVVASSDADAGTAAKTTVKSPKTGGCDR